MAHYDVLLKGGTLLDPAQGIHARQDVAFADGLVAAVRLGRGLTRLVVDPGGSDAIWTNRDAGRPALNHRMPGKR